MALELAANVVDIPVPPESLEALVRDPAGGVDLARDLVLALRDSGGLTVST